MRRLARDESGVTLVELVVTIMVGLVVLLGTLTITEVSAHNSAKTAARVDANQRARVVLQRLMDQLHSACLGPDAPPVLPGSDGSSITFLHATGSAVAPAPVKRVVTLTGSTLAETVYASTGGVAPDWTFSTTGSNYQLLTRVGAASLGTPPATVPLFRYYADQNGQLSTPLPTPLSTADAARVVQVAVAFSALPSNTPVADPKAAVSVSDSTYLRFSPFSEDVSKVNGPCA